MAVAKPDFYKVVRDTPLTVIDAEGVLANDTGSTLTAQFLGGGTSGASSQGGSVTIAPGGGFTYTPPAGYAGEDEFSYDLLESGVFADNTYVNLGVTEPAQQNDIVAIGFPDHFNTLQQVVGFKSSTGVEQTLNNGAEWGGIAWSKKQTGKWIAQRNNYAHTQPPTTMFQLVLGEPDGSFAVLFDQDNFVTPSDYTSLRDPLPIFEASASRILVYLHKPNGSFPTYDYELHRYDSSTDTVATIFTSADFDPLLAAEEFNSIELNPACTRMLFARPDSARVYIADADGSSLAELTSSLPVPFVAPFRSRLSDRQGWWQKHGFAWNPDGSNQIIYTSNDGGVGHLASIDDTGTGSVLWTGDSTHTTFLPPVFSPDGTKIAWIVTSDETSGSPDAVYVCNSDGTGVTDITHGDPLIRDWTIFFGLCWHPDGSKLLTSVSGNGGDLLVVTVGGVVSRVFDGLGNTQGLDDAGGLVWEDLSWAAASAPSGANIDTHIAF